MAERRSVSIGMRQPRNTAVMASSQANDLVYSARRSILEPCLSWLLTDKALICERDGIPYVIPEPPRIAVILRALIPWLSIRPAKSWPPRISYCDIATIRTRFDPTRFDRNRYRCDLRSTTGDRTTLFSTHYVDIASFKDQQESYAPFIRAMIMRVQISNPSAVITTGLSWPAYILQHGALLLTLFALLTMLGVVGVPGLGSGWIKLVILTSYGGILWRYARRNMPKNIALPPQE